ncbi:MAG TPA: LysR substrate-binding domain-containing protein [Chthoniobacterales bacterium]
MIAQIRSFLAVLEEGSLHRAAARLRLSQSSLSRQMQALEHELGGRLLDRTSTGVRPTNGGYALAAKMSGVLDSYDAAMVAVRRLVRGDSEQLRIGCVASAVRDHLEPALVKLRKDHPEAKIKLLDLSPGEQIAALRRGEIDVALLDQGENILSRDFYVRKIAVIPSLVILPADHRLALRKKVRLAELKDETFVSGTDADMPGYNRRVTQMCRKHGKFRPKFIGQPQSFAEGLALVVNDDAILLLPSFVRHQTTPCATMVPITDEEATWNVFVVWQRGQTTGPLRALLKALLRIA